MGYTNTDDHTLYTCSSDYEGHYSIQCEGQCVVAASNQQSYCQCKVGAKYCGYELYMGAFSFSGYIDHELYECVQTHEVKSLGNCGAGCFMVRSGDSYCAAEESRKSCAPGLRYCGYEMDKNNVYEGGKAHDLYECDESGNGKNIGECPSGCTEIQTTHSYCADGMSAAKPY